MDLRLNTLSRRIGSGFALMILLLAIAAGATIQQLMAIRKASDKMEAVRVPVVQASTELLSGINHASSALRGWIFLRDPEFKKERLHAWEQEVVIPLKDLEHALMTSDGDLAIGQFKELERLVEHLRITQEEAERADKSEALVVVSDRSAPALLHAQRAIRSLVSEQKALMRAELDDLNTQIAFLNALQWMLFLMGAAAGVALAIVITRSITRPVNTAVTVAGDIARGDLDGRIELSGTKEVEILGTALEGMRTALKSRSDESRRHAWLANGQRSLDEVMRGEKSITRLAGELIMTMAEYTGSQVGAFYLVDEQGKQLCLKGEHGLDKNAPRTFEIGEGLVGQAAADGSIRMLLSVEPDQLRVTSTLIDASPVHVIIAPFSFEGSITGVLELGRLTKFDEGALEFIQNSIQSIGIAINTAMDRERINDLLEETQRQSEELQMQQEELQQTNEELEEQAQQLKIQQEELQVTNEELEEQTQAVDQRNNALERMRREVEQKAEQLEITSKYKSEFLANMSHELRTPLNSLLILANHLAQNKTGNLGGEEIESAQVITKCGYDLLNLINDILDLSKVEAGKLELEFTNVSASVVLEDIRSAFEHVAKDKGLSFDLRIDASAPANVNTDRQRLGQVIKNLVSNAIKFTHGGGVSVSIIGHSEGGWSIVVHDTGIGIPPEKQKLIFEAFQQADGGTSRRYGGTGLGLSISREIARLLGGRITLQSEVERGATFTFTIPARVPTIPVGPDTSFPEPQPIITRYSTGYPPIADHRDVIEGDDRVLLIIEDDATFARILSVQARQRGFKYLTASTGEDGLALVRKYRPNAILLDIDLPGMDGLAVLREIKGDPHLRHIPVHIISVNERTLDPIRAGAVEYLVKPVEQDQIDQAFNRIEDMVQRKMKNLLIVEDDAAQRLAIKKLIGNGDVVCLEAGSAAEGLEILRSKVIDCIVLDIGLPDASGFELLKRLRDTMGITLPPIIVYTGKDLTIEQNDELRMYAETIIVKGIRSEERLLDETALFLHRTVKDLPDAKRSMIIDLHDQEAIFRGRTVLLVDDDMRNVFALTKILAARGMHVLRAENGRIALEILDIHPEVDMVLMDIMMPEMDGYECMRQIRKRPGSVDLPIISLTAKAMKEDMRKCIDAGANDYISKPVDMERLFSLMRIWISKGKSIINGQ